MYFDSKKWEKMTFVRSTRIEHRERKTDFINAVVIAN